MTPKRYRELEQNMNGVLADEEKHAGWHWCVEWDYLLVGPTMQEWDCCGCYTTEERKALEAK